jgi:photosystem II stability/assembly factor-like uncharacterized protein
MQGRISRRAAAFSIAGLVLAAAPSWAADDVWTYTGQPSGGQIFKVVVDPVHTSTLYAMANQGIFGSTDGGAHWNMVFDMSDQDGMDLAIDPLQPSNVYVAGINDGLWKSEDSGKTWSHLPGIDAAHVVVVDPVNEGVVYTIANVGYANGCDVYKSVNGGATWHLLGTGLTGNAEAWCTRIAVDPADPQVLYLATEVGEYQSAIRQGSPLSGLYTSVDGGAHWAQHLSTLPFADVVIDPSDDQVVYAGHYVSTDAGANWAPIPGMSSDITVTAVDPANSQLLWGVDFAAGALWTSPDQGATWNQVTTMPHGNAVYNVAYATPTTLFASSRAFGVYKSADGGATWDGSTDGLAGVYPSNILVDGTGAMYMGTEGTGVFKSTDGGATWTMKDDGITVQSDSTGIWVHAIAVASTPGTVYETDQNELYKTTDGGDTWSDIASHDDGSINALATDPQQPDTVYVGTGGGHVLKSIDGGAHWTQSVSGLSADGVWSLAVDPSDSDVLYIGGFQSSLSKSTDGGVTWSPAHTGMPAGSGVGCIAVDPKDSDNVYSCPVNHGIYKSTDGGQTWARAGTGLPDYAFDILQVDPNDSSVIYAAIPTLAVFVSTDAGEHWVVLGDPSALSSTAQRTESSLSTDSSSAGETVAISSLAVDPRHAAQVYGVAGGGKVYTLSVADIDTSGGSGGGGSKPPKTPVSSGGGSGGGGGFSLLAGIALLGLGFLRRRR